jgi:hypothetical protein
MSQVETKDVSLLAYAMHAPSIESIKEREEVIKKWLKTHNIEVIENA